MTITTDFDPIAATEIIEKQTGLLARKKARDNIKPVGFGRERVFVSQEGDVHAIKGAITAGEKYWTSGGTWLSVDVTDHPLTYSFTHRDTDGTAGYQITVTLTVRVVDAAAVAHRHIRSVRGYIEPTLRAAIGAALGSVRPQESSHNVTKLNVRLDETARRLNDSLQPGRAISVEDWLSVKLTGIEVGFDLATIAHRDALVTAARSMELAKADQDLRSMWAVYLRERMADPLTRTIEIYASEPTQENLEKVVGKISADEQWQDTEVLKLLTTLIDQNHFDDVDQLTASRILLDGLIRPGTSAASALPTSAAADKGMGTAEVIDSVDDIETAQDESDRSWDD
jgi:hypothetical protein